MTSYIISCSLSKVFSLSLGKQGGPHLGGYYKMADFQRPYVWTQEKIQKILDDVDELRINPAPKGKREKAHLYKKDSPEYFLGSLCFCRDDSKKYLEILDGQQRITSLFILACVLDKQVTDYRKETGGKRKCVEVIAKRWDGILAGLNKKKNWKRLLVFSNPQSKKQIEKIYWTFTHDYECLKRDSGDVKNAPEVDDMNIFELTLFQDVQRFEYILEKGKFAVLILNSRSEAEQFFQGENNRGRPMSVLDLLKAYHMRHEAARQDDQDIGCQGNVLTPLEKIGDLWRSFGFSLEDDRKSGKQLTSKEVELLNRQKKEKKEKQQIAHELITKLVLPAMLMQHGIEPWSVDKLENLPLLKGITGTFAGDCFIDEKLEGMRNHANESWFDLRVPVRPGLPFFQEMEQYFKLAQAINYFLGKELAEKDRGNQSVTKNQGNPSKTTTGAGDLLKENRVVILQLAMIAWADRFLKAKIMRSSCTWKDVFDALVEDGNFHLYAKNFQYFLDRLKNINSKNKDAERVGAYNKLRNETLSKIIQFSEPENNLLFLPHRSSSPRECLRKLKIATHPNELKFTRTIFYEGYQNAYKKEELRNDRAENINDCE